MGEFVIGKWIKTEEMLPVFPPGEPDHRNSDIHVIGVSEYGHVGEYNYERNIYAKLERNRQPRWTRSGRGAAAPKYWMPMPQGPNDGT